MKRIIGKRKRCMMCVVGILILCLCLQRGMGYYKDLQIAQREVESFCKSIDGITMNLDVALYGEAAIREQALSGVQSYFHLLMTQGLISAQDLYHCSPEECRMLTSEMEEIQNEVDAIVEAFRTSGSLSSMEHNRLMQFNEAFYVLRETMTVDRILLNQRKLEKEFFMEGMEEFFQSAA